MNAKFFDVKKSKQDAIINAALKVFLANGYKKASTDVIVQEAGISKGLLFHYFISKKGLYEFICDYSIKYMTMELTRAVNKSEKDFFKVQVQVERAKTRVMKNYPYMQQFLNSLRFEKNPDALEAIGNKCEQLDETYNAIYCQTDNTRFLDKIDINKIIDMITWMSDGFIRDKFCNTKPDLDEMNEEFEKYLNMLRRHFYRSATDELISIAREESVERNDSVMEQMRQNVSAEERLTSSKIVTVAEQGEEDTEKAEDISDKIILIKAVENASAADSVSAEDTAVKESIPAAGTDVEETEINETVAQSVSEEVEPETTEAADKDIEIPLVNAGSIPVSVSSAAIPVTTTPISLWSAPEDSLETAESEEKETVAVEETETENNREIESASEEKESVVEIIETEPSREVEVEVIQKSEQIEELLEEDKPATTDVAAENATIMGDNDEIAFPSWWTSAIGAPATAEEETVAVTFNIPNQTSQPGATFGRYVDDALEAEMSDDAFSTESFMQLAAGAVEAVNNSEAGVPQNTPIMAEMPVPEDILKTTLNNIDEDDDEPWTPRPVRQIRL